VSNPNDVFFNPLINKDEKLQIFDSLVKAGGSFFVKTEKGEILELPCEKMSGERGVLCRAPEGVNSADLLNKEVVISFEVNSEKYFFKTKCLKTSELLGFDFRGTLYFMQTRHTIRMQIPAELKAGVTIQKHNKNLIEHHGDLLDLSLGGCKCAFLDYPENFVKDDILEVKVTQTDLEEVFVKAQIRSVKMETINEVQKRSEVGIQFIELSDYKETEVELYFRSLQKKVAEIADTKSDSL